MLITNTAKQPIKIERFKILKPLGKGGFGIVYHVLDTMKTENEYALKLFHNSLNMQRIINQLEALKTLNTSQYFLNTYLSKKILNQFFIVFEYANGGNLKQRVKQNILSEDLACEIILELLNAIEFLQNNSILHGDIKAENILIKDDKYYLSDWDIIKNNPPVKTLNIESDNDFAAPEIYKGIQDYASDIYSLGCTLYFMLSASHIYDFTDKTDFSEKMFAHLYTQPIPHAKLSEKMFYLIDRMTDKNYQNRATIIEIRKIIHSQANTYINISKENIIDNNKSKFNRYLFMANQGVSYAQNIIGLMHEESLEVEKNLSLAHAWYEKAASQGLTKAIFNLALVYKMGKGCNVDYAKAFELFTKSSEQNHSRSFFHIADMYEHGLGVEQNLVLARDFYEKAAYNGYKQAYVKLKDCKLF